MNTSETDKKNSIKRYIAAVDRIAELEGRPRLSTLLNKVQLPDDLTKATKSEFEAIQSGTGKISEYSLKCLILLENDLIDQRKCDYLCEIFDAIAGIRPSSAYVVAPNGPANEPKW